MEVLGDGCEGDRHPAVAVRIAAEMPETWEREVGAPTHHRFEDATCKTLRRAVTAPGSSLSVATATCGRRSCTVWLWTVSPQNRIVSSPSPSK